MPQQGYMAPQGYTSQPGYGVQPGYMPQQGMQPVVTQPIMSQPMAGVPVFMGIPQLIYSQDPLQELSMSIKATIRQQPELLEIVTGCETENRYHVFTTLNNGTEKYLFKCKEESTCFQRQCCPSDTREFNMRIKHISSQVDFQGGFENYYATFVKPFKCTCCCLARPSIVGLLHSNNQPFGEVTELCTCCNPIFEVRNGGMLKYTITIDCCQCGFCCRKSCGKLNYVEAQIHNGNEEGPIVGNIIKRAAQNMMEMIGDADTYDINFPKDATPEEKFTLIMAGLFLDYRYYETNASDDKQERDKYRRR
jgi:hypothetical protein